MALVGMTAATITTTASTANTTPMRSRRVLSSMMRASEASPDACPRAFDRAPFPLAFAFARGVPFWGLFACDVLLEPV